MMVNTPEKSSPLFFPQWGLGVDPSLPISLPDLFKGESSGRGNQVALFFRS